MVIHLTPEGCLRTGAGEDAKTDAELVRSVAGPSRMNYDLGYFDLEEKTLQPLDNPFVPGCAVPESIRPIKGGNIAPSGGGAQNGDLMYFATILLLLLIFPAASVIAEALRPGHAVDDMLLIGKWYVFWAVGVRLLIAGLRQVLQPAFTALEIFDIADLKAHAIVREIGFGNISMGLLGLLSLWHPDWRFPAGIVGGLYYCLAGLMHVARPRKNAKELVAMISDLFAAFVLLGFVVSGR